MREQTKHRLALLVTRDAAVETAIRHEAAATGVDLEVQRDAREAMSTVIDGCGGEAFAIVDLGKCSGRRRLLETAGGSLPVLAITGRVWPWLSSMARHHRIGAALKKPFSVDELHEAWQRVRALSSQAGRAWQ